MIKHSTFALLFYGLLGMTNVQATTLKIATFNVSMEALNYSEHKRGETANVSTNTLANALSSDHQQIKNIAEIIQRVNPDIILLNEFDYLNDNNHALKSFITDYLNKGQQDQKAVEYPYFYQGPVNTGVNSGFDLDGNGEKGKLPGDGFGYGHFPGHFGMALLSKYPIDFDNIRSFQYFKWRDMPNALKPIDPVTNKPWFSKEAWQALRLSSKSHWDIPVIVDGKAIHVLASHPTPPVFDGPEDRNGKRNHDEIRFWHDYITPELAGYIYDDNGQKGGIKAEQAFVMLGDFNATTVDGNAIKAGIASLLNNDKIQDVMPQSQAGKLHKPDNINAKHHTSNWGMRVDYVLPSSFGFTVNDSGIFWPLKDDESYRLIKDRSASSDHRLVWLELTTK
ncbi:endonuclease/exonuclease/phosphatase family protein [Colwellia piezophila]|uniref:endonuclease/exonuclease/phosphatase family protein n=1 Tax=Colwellia piezophila TaxID=211668 RepID=UPI000365C4DB